MLVRTRYDDGGFSGGNLERPALPQLITDIRAGRIDIVVVYNVDRLTGAGAKAAERSRLVDAQGGAAHAVTRRQEGPDRTAIAFASCSDTVAQSAA